MKLKMRKNNIVTLYKNKYNRVTDHYNIKMMAVVSYVEPPRECEKPHSSTFFSSNSGP